MTEHERQHQLKKPRGFEPGIQPTKHPDKARAAFVDGLIKSWPKSKRRIVPSHAAKAATPAKNLGDLSGVWKMRNGELVTVLPMFATAGRYWEQLTERTWDGRRSRQNESWDLLERITGPHVQTAPPSTVDLERSE